MNMMLVAYAPCGCIASAYLGLEDGDDLTETFKEWAREGYTVKVEERESIGARKCAEHSTVKLSDLIGG